MNFIRRKISIKFFLYPLLILPAFLHQPAFSAAWVQPKGEWVSINNAENYKSCGYWTKSGSFVESSPCYEQFYFNPYFEYGATDKLTVGTSVFFWEIHQNDQTKDFNLGSVELFTRYQLWHKNYSEVSVQLTYNIPFQNVPFLNNVDPLQANAVSGSYLFQNFAEVRLMYGTGNKLPKILNSSWFISLEAAYVQAFDGAADQYHGDIQLGWKSPAEKWRLGFKTFNAYTLHNPSNNLQPNFDLSTLEASVAYFITHNIGLEAGAYQDVYGTNVGKGTQPFIALWLQS